MSFCPDQEKVEGEGLISITYPLAGPQFAN